MKTMTFSTLILMYILNPAFSQTGWFTAYNFSNPYAALYSCYFTDVNTGYVVGFRSGILPSVFKTTNGGSNWGEQITPLRDSSNFYFRSVVFTDINTGFIASAYNTNNYIGRILKTTNSGLNWITIPLPVNNHMTNIFFVNSSTGYASGFQTILKTTDAGSSWVYQYSGAPFFLFSIYFTNVNTGYVVGNFGLILRTTNGGDNWVSMNSGTGEMLWGLTFADANTGIAIGGSANNTSNIILRTTDAGSNWAVIPYSISTCLLWSVKFVNTSTGWIAGWCGQILKTTNSGINWYNQQPPYNDYLRTYAFLNANTGFLVSDDGNVFKTTDGGGNFVGVSPSINELPEQYELLQNYPNPFNPITKIKFDIAKDLKNQIQDVKLVVYDVLGREVITLVNERLRAGVYEIDWDATNYPSGIYFYKLIAGDFTETRKMLLVK